MEATAQADAESRRSWVTLAHSESTLETNSYARTTPQLVDLFQRLALDDDLFANRHVGGMNGRAVVFSEGAPGRGALQHPSRRPWHPWHLRTEGSTMTTIHIVDTDPSAGNALAGLLSERGHDSACFTAAHDFYDQLNRFAPGCAVIDWAMSPTCGLEMVERTRQLVGGRMGIIVLTPNESEEQVVSALGAGADDCVCKQTKDTLVAARIEALLRRLEPTPVTIEKRIVRGPYTLDLGSRIATVDGCDVGLAPREFDLAWTLFSQLSRLFTKSELLALIWGKKTEFGAHTISQHVYALRKKLKFDKQGFKLESVYATGYRLECVEAPLRSRVIPPYNRNSGSASSAWC
jgi:DNA-binding response OmpR family regulator